MIHAHSSELGRGVLHSQLELRLYLRIHQPQSHLMLYDNEHVINVGHHNGHIYISLYPRIQRLAVVALDKAELLENIAK